ncbi:MAG: bifunctional aspartate kinase/diaminopimelate decarboxylase [Bradymonadia bacterium]
MTEPVQFVVLKFGGTSVATADRWRTIADLVRQRQAEGLIPVVVCSALSGISDLLQRLLDDALAERHTETLAEIEARHAALAEALGLEGLPAEVRSAHALLERLTLGASLAGEYTPRMQARVMAQGELMSTQLGAAWLSASGVQVTWVDARSCLSTAADPDRPLAARYLDARVEDHADEALAARLSAYKAVITQGFIAAGPGGETALLGRGGSDTSGALFTARLSPKVARLEIWTDVPGVYTANPREVPDARLLTRLDYDEAQEIATAGAKVLHPRSLGPVRRHGVPLHLKCTPRPELPGTVIAAQGAAGAEVKAIALRKGVALVSMNTLGMWQQVGFLADIFGAFKRHGASVDLVSTSESNVTASLDAGQAGVDLDALLADLNDLCAARLITGCAAISLVGRRIRAILHRLGPALSAFEEQRIHMVAQAASDLNLTLVVDERSADTAMQRLHGLLFGEGAPRPGLGPTWREIFAPAQGAAPTPDTTASTSEVWWRRETEALLQLATEQTPTYVYSSAELQASAQALTSLSHVDRVLYAIKANDHPEVLQHLAAGGVQGFECVSVGELDHLASALPSWPAAQTLFTSNFASKDELAEGIRRGGMITIDALHPLQTWPEIFAGREIMLRLDPGRGQGHHAHVRTAGPQSKFGISPAHVEAAVAAARAAGAKITGLHAHAGSGILDGTSWQHTALFLAEAARACPEARVLDLGGGLGVVEKPGQRPLDLQQLDETLGQFKAAHPGFDLWLEPGRFLVATAGVILTRVTQIKTKGDRRYIGVDAGMHTLIRPALYGAWHQIVNLSKLGAPLDWRANIVGPICETGDTLGRDRALPVTEEGDVLLIATAGAYGRVMSSDYNRRGWAREVML